MSIKSWSCPGCHRDFIVDAESTRDTCPWCNATVEDSSGDLKIVTESEKPREATATASTPSESPSAGSGGQNSGTTAGGTQSWWPFEYSS